MAKMKNLPKHGSRTTSEGETVSGYFRRIFDEKPSLLEQSSNKELLDRWLKDHPGNKEVPKNIKGNLANIKSVLRSQGRKQTKRAYRNAQEAGEAPNPVRRAGTRLEILEEHIDEALTVARNMDRELLKSVIEHLRRARNEVVWKMGM